MRERQFGEMEAAEESGFPREIGDRTRGEAMIDFLADCGNYGGELLNAETEGFGLGGAPKLDSKADGEIRVEDDCFFERCGSLLDGDGQIEIGGF